MSSGCKLHIKIGNFHNTIWWRIGGFQDSVINIGVSRIFHGNQMDLTSWQCRWVICIQSLWLKESFSRQLHKVLTLIPKKGIHSVSEIILVVGGFVPNLVRRWHIGLEACLANFRALVQIVFEIFSFSRQEWIPRRYRCFSATKN